MLLIGESPGTESPESETVRGVAGQRRRDAAPQGHELDRPGGPITMGFRGVGGRQRKAIQGPEQVAQPAQRGSAGRSGAWKNRTGAKGESYV